MVTLSSCAADPDLPWDDAGVNPCAMQIVADTSQVTAPAYVTVQGIIESQSVGYELFSWSVTDAEGLDVTPEPPGADRRTMTFYAGSPGVYTVTLNGQLNDDNLCAEATERVVAVHPDANIELFRLRFLAGAGRDVPAQEQLVEVTGGVDVDLGEVMLNDGWQTTGLVQTAQGTPLAAYIRASTVESSLERLTFEGFSDAAGEFVMRAVSAGLDYLIVPLDNAVAPQRIPGVTPGQTEFVVNPGIAASGTVVDGAGGAVDDARVSLRVDDVPSTLATTDATGSFALSARAGSLTAVAVVPPAASGLLALSLPQGADASFDANSGPLAVAYTPGHSSRSVTMAALAMDGVTQAAATRAAFIARPIAGAGTLTTDAGNTLELTGSARISLVADGAGTLAGTLPEAEYDVILEPADPAYGAPTLRYVDLRPGQPTPASLTVDPAATVTGTVRGPDGLRVGNASISAMPTGVLTQTPAASASATSASNGSFSLPLIAGGQYQLQVRTADAAYIHGWREIDVPATGAATDIGDWTLGRSVWVAGRVRLPGAVGAADVIVRALCLQCPDDQRERILSETITDSSGQFLLPIPDPGIGL